MAKTKYRNVKTVHDGITFDSKKEARRYMGLKLMQQGGYISDLRLQVRFPLKVDGVLICTYVADFCYIDNGRQVTEDCKGMKTPMYNLKKKLMKAIHGIEILET